MANAVVFAYSSVGYECLSVLLRRGVNVTLVYTHEDDPGETQWFESVYNLAVKNNLKVLTSEPDVETVKAAKPDVIFSFYYTTSAWRYPASRQLCSNCRCNGQGRA